MDPSVRPIIAGRFEVNPAHIIGKGAFCRVTSGLLHTGYDRVTHSQVAIKTMLKRESGQLQNEANLLKRLKALEALHSKGVLHRDIKPNNILTGLDTLSDSFFLIDFGFSAEYSVDGHHRRCKSNVSFQGNVYWATNNVLKGLTASRRDDLESLLYVLLYLTRGDLPWYIGHDRCKAEIVIARKRNMSAVDMCKGLPPVFSTVLAHVQSLGYAEKPDYQGYRAKFREEFLHRGFKYDTDFDWKHVLKGEKMMEMSPDLISLLNSKRDDFGTASDSAPEKLIKTAGDHIRAASTAALNVTIKKKKAVGKKKYISRTIEKIEISGLRERMAILNSCVQRSPGQLLQMSRTSSSNSPTSVTSGIVTFEQRSDEPLPLPPLDSPEKDSEFHIALIEVEDTRTLRAKSVLETEVPIYLIPEKDSTVENETPKRSVPISSEYFRTKVLQRRYCIS